MRFPEKVLICRGAGLWGTGAGGGGLAVFPMNSPGGGGSRGSQRLTHEQPQGWGSGGVGGQEKAL